MVQELPAALCTSAVRWAHTVVRLYPVKSTRNPVALLTAAGVATSAPTQCGLSVLTGAVCALASCLARPRRSRTMRPARAAAKAARRRELRLQVTPEAEARSSGAATPWVLTAARERAWQHCDCARNTRRGPQALAARSFLHVGKLKTGLAECVDFRRSAQLGFTASGATYSACGAAAGCRV